MFKLVPATSDTKPIGGTAPMRCHAKGCHCGQPIVIRMINGRRVPVHI